MYAATSSSSSFAAKIDARAISRGVAAASAVAGAFFGLAQPPATPASLSSTWKAQEKARALPCPRVARGRPVVLNPFKNVVV